ncbi:hypothetical protein [Limosilactobacillus sp.]|uniref:hypothetical protein n=1 Tax=Limosilactobacillus sp. TaxID=2773925 RepID=UPI00345F14D1
MKNAKLAAFTLAECLLALFVVAIVAVAASFGVHSAGQINHQNLTEPVAWYHFLLEMESPKRKLELRKVTHVGVDEVELRSQINGKQYTLACSNHFVMYLKGANRGYLPLYGPIAKRTLRYRQLDRQRVYVEVKNREGQTHHAIICFANPTHSGKQPAKKPS